MWRWPVVEKAKALWNANKQKTYTIHAKLIAMAAEKWWDPDTNSYLADAIEKARKDNIPSDNISRAIKKWTWEDKSWEQIQSIIYEWYWVWWVAVMVATLTDNKNRTAKNMRHIFSKYWWNMWESGSVGFIFEKKWVIFIDLTSYEREILEEMVFETDTEDFIIEDQIFKITTSLEDLVNVREFFKSKNIELKFSWISYIPNNEVEVTDFDNVLKLTKMIDDFREDEDVENIYVNMIIDDTLQKEVDDFIEKNTFKT